MKEVKIKEQIINIPENWSEVNIRQFKQIMSAVQLGIKEEKTNLQIVIDILFNLYSINQNDIFSMQMDDFNKIVENFLFINEKIQTDKIEYIEWENKKYKIKEKYNQLSVGEMLSVETLFSGKKDESIVTNIDNVLSVIIRKVKEDGTLEEFDASKVNEYKEMVLDWPIKYVYNYTLFFSNGE